jgi:hypothetical protein
MPHAHRSTPTRVADAPTAAVHPTSLWRNRDFVLLWGGQVVSAIVGSEVSLQYVTGSHPYLAGCRAG